MIIGLLGQSGVGKDTAGAVIAKKLGGTCIAFADPIKRFLMGSVRLKEKQLWGTLDDKAKVLPKSQVVPRPLEQTWGELPAPWADLLNHEVRGRASDGRDDRQVLERKLRAWWGTTRREKKLTSRRVMQTFGTELGRKQLPSGIWRDTGIEIAQIILAQRQGYTRAQGLLGEASTGPSDAVVITDVRFRDEVLAIKHAGGLVYRIIRKGKNNEASHASEAEQLSVPDFWLDGILYNRFDKDSFESSVAYFAENLRNRCKYIL